MKAAKIILIVLLVLKTVIELVKAIAEEEPKKRVSTFLGVLLGIGVKAYLYYLVGIFNL